MPTILTDVEVRVLGSLIEKQVTTPEYYPLTLNALTLACNQKNNRNPVTALAETTVDEAVESLRAKNLTYVFYGSSSRVPEQTLQSLIGREPEPLATRLPRQAGQKEARFAHLLAGPVNLDYAAEIEHPREAVSRQGTGERVSKLEQEVNRLSSEMEALRQQFADFKTQFD